MKCHVSTCRRPRVKKDVLCRRHVAARGLWEKTVRVIASGFPYRRVVGVLLACLLLAACGSRRRSVALEPRWTPLARVVEEPSTPAGFLVTRGGDVEVRRLSWFLALSDEQREAALIHERVHAKRQLATGLRRWLRRYENDPGFRLVEEQLAFEPEIHYLAHPEGRVHTDEGPLFARAMAGPFYGSMIGYDDALAWCEATYRDALR